jgi:hypothetical protein
MCRNKEQTFLKNIIQFVVNFQRYGRKLYKMKSVAIYSLLAFADHIANVTVINAFVHRPNGKRKSFAPVTIPAKKSTCNEAPLFLFIVVINKQ